MNSSSDEPTIKTILLQSPPPEESKLDDDRIFPWVDHNNTHLSQYKVRTGDSLKNIAESIGWGWEDIAILNWGTSDPDEINWYLANYFVCTEKKGANYLFNYSDTPGILLLPRPIEMRNRKRMQTVRASRFKD